MKKIYIKRIKDRDEKYFEEIYNEYYSLVNFVVYNILKDVEDTKDICQEVFYTLYDKIDQYKGKNFKYWLLQIAKNKALNHLKKTKLENEYLSIEITNINVNIQKDNIISGVLWNTMQKCLTDDEIKIVVLKVVFSFSFLEISEEMGISKSNCYRIYKESIKKLNIIMRGGQ